MALTEDDKQWLVSQLQGHTQSLTGHFDERAQSLKGYVKEYVDQWTQALKEYIDERTQALKEYIDERTQALKEYIDERTHDAETRLLRAFADYNVAADVRMRKLEADTSNIDTSTTKRLGEIERRLTDLDIRTMRLESEHRPPQQQQ